MTSVPKSLATELVTALNLRVAVQFQLVWPQRVRVAEPPQQHAAAAAQSLSLWRGDQLPALV